MALYPARTRDVPNTVERAANAFIVCVVTARAFRSFFVKSGAHRCIPYRIPL